MRRKFVAGNWKMHGDFQRNTVLLDAVKEASDVPCDVAVFAPFPYLAHAAGLLAGSDVRVGAQNLSEHAAGAFTGEVSGAMLQDVGCTHVIVGHSERRALYGESDDVVAAKFEAALSNGLVPVLCVGETLAERQAGSTEAVVFRQLDAVVRRVGAAALAGSVVAYEPVWAIGTGLTATPAQAQAVHQAVRQRIAAADAGVAAGLRIVYGGSVKAANAAELFGQPDIDGGLVGGASLDAQEFLSICRAAA